MSWSILLRSMDGKDELRRRGGMPVGFGAQRDNPILSSAS